MEISCAECNTSYDIPLNKLPKPKQGYNAVAQCPRCGGRIVLSSDWIHTQAATPPKTPVEDDFTESDHRKEPESKAESKLGGERAETPQETPLEDDFLESDRFDESEIEPEQDTDSPPFSDDAERDAYFPENEALMDDLAAFIVKNRAKYLSKFKKFNNAGIDRFAVTWHWPAFLFNVGWFLYRKLYFWALIAFVGLCIPGFNFISLILWGVLANYLYYKHAQKKILALHAFDPSADITSELARIGGVNKWVLVLGATLVGVAVVVILAAIILPKLAGF